MSRRRPAAFACQGRITRLRFTWPEPERGTVQLELEVDGATARLLAELRANDLTTTRMIGPDRVELQLHEVEP